MIPSLLRGGDIVCLMGYRIRIEEAPEVEGSWDEALGGREVEVDSGDFSWMHGGGGRILRR